MTSEKLLGHFEWSFVLARLQRRFWILRGQTCVRRYIKNCVFCQLRRAKSSSQMMAALPKERLLSGERAFFATGCDFFGPIYVTEFRRKIKRWGCIFVCFSTRAVHIEVCYRMTCDSFLEAFFRFFNTRGHAVRFVWCDNGSNLKAGANELTKSFANVKWKKVVDRWSAKGIVWHHIPPYAPSKGGNWERMVGLAKGVLSAIAARDYYRSINTEELSTYFKEIEGILNWRPLTSVSSSSNDFDYLSPMSLLNSALIPSTLPGHMVKSESFRNSWKTSQLMAQEFWGRWQRLYLPTLIPRKKWNFPQRNFEIGDLVLLREYSVVKNQWFRGRIVNVLPNKDGKVRCLEVKKPDGSVVLRDVGSVCRLEIDMSE